MLFLFCLFLMSTHPCLLCYLPHSQLEGASEVSWSERTARSRELLCRALLHVIQCVCQHARRPEDQHTARVFVCNLCSKLCPGRLNLTVYLTLWWFCCFSVSKKSFFTQKDTRTGCTVLPHRDLRSPGVGSSRPRQPYLQT